MPDASRSEKPRACANCSRAKAKCVWPSTHDSSDAKICQRCSKTNLTCSRLQTGEKKKRGKSIHAKVIERKLDDIMSLLSRDREQTAHTNWPAEHQLFPSNSFTPATTTASYEVDHSDPSTQLTPASDQPRAEAIMVIPGFQVSFEEADQVLQEYMTDMVPQFPFVPLPACSAYDMYKDKPLLLKTILWACRPPGPDLTAAFERWFRQHISHQTVVLLEKSLEVLQVLLLFFAWNDIHFYANASDTSLLQLAVGLVGDLGLTKCTDISGPASGSIVEDAAHLRNEVQVRAQHTNADRRAVLGVFYITSILFCLLGKPSRLEYTPYFDDCCRQLLQDQEYSTDSLLVYLIKIRQIAINVNDTFWKKSELASDRPFQSIHALAIATVQKELDAFMDHLPEFLESNHLLRSHCAAIRIRLFEPVIHAYRSDKLEPRHLRSRIMWDCLKSTQMLFDAFLLVPVETYPSFTFVSMLHLALAIIKAARLLCMDDHDWDLETARSSFDFQDMLQQLIEHFEAASRIGGPRCMIPIDGQPLFLGHAERFRWIKGWYLSKLNPGITHSTSTLMDSVFVQSAEQCEGFEFWQQLSDLTYGDML